ncbi:hypothetical protein JRO89_XS09G0127400 [Xanthoceras sorbifolium]|uniref:Uncharacterized protein n=1 Tax=Xanthoceras sorbifolium TaxID=99658 RepID=A0ABQ8HL45_9ROSI|nr:hypothetical protein JRO89_XS09G0127400 [Xanthoceras sorbifolium]
MVSSRKLAAIVSSIAAFIYFVLIIFQIPLFRVPCRVGICKTPIEMTCSQMIASEIFPVFVVKTLLYPGAFAKSLMKGTPLPSYTKLLKLYNFTNLKRPPAYDLQRLEVCMYVLRTCMYRIVCSFTSWLDSSWKLLVCGRSSCWSDKSRKNEPIWDTSNGLGVCKRSHFQKIW